jgi:hypothetical protein
MNETDKIEIPCYHFNSKNGCKNSDKSCKYLHIEKKEFKKNKKMKKQLTQTLETVSNNSSISREVLKVIQKKINTNLKLINELKIKRNKDYKEEFKLYQKDFNSIVKEVKNQKDIISKKYKITKRNEKINYEKKSELYISGTDFVSPHVISLFIDHLKIYLPNQRMEVLYDFGSGPSNLGIGFFKEGMTDEIISYDINDLYTTINYKYEDIFPLNFKNLDINKIKEGRVLENIILNGPYNKFLIEMLKKAFTLLKIGGIMVIILGEYMDPDKKKTKSSGLTKEVKDEIDEFKKKCDTIPNFNNTKSFEIKRNGACFVTLIKNKN